MLKRSERGMAKVSVLWLIVILVAFLAALAMFFINNGELENQRIRADKAEKAVEEHKASNAKNSEDIVNLSAVFGFYDETKSSRTDPAVARAALKSLEEAIPDVKGAKNFQAALPFVINTLNAEKARAAELDSQARARATEIEGLQKTLRENGEKAQGEQTNLSRQITDLQEQVNNLQQGYEKRLADMAEQLKARDALRQQAEASLAAKTREWEQNSEVLRARMAEMGRKLMPFVKEPQSIDGRVLSVSKDLGVGWIDLGAKHRLPVGTRFSVMSGTVGSTRVKAAAEVIKVEGDMAQVTFSDQRDPYDPPAAGDAIYNPVYDPKGERNALLVGSFSGKYGPDQLQQLLASMGVHVQKSLDQATDFLVVGSEMYTDENKQPVETPIQPSDLPVYKEAIAQGVQIVLLKDLRNYFRF